MLPISPIAIAIGVALFLARTNLAGLIGGALLGMALMHLWPEYFMPVYTWVGGLLDSLGIGDWLDAANQSAPVTPDSE